MSMGSSESFREVADDWHKAEVVAWSAEQKDLLTTYGDGTKIADEHAQNPKVLSRSEQLLGKKECLDSFKAMFDTYLAFASLPETAAPEITPNS